MKDSCCLKGNEGFECVADGNLMTCRSAILFLILLAMAATPCLEQPQSSLMSSTAWLEWIPLGIRKLTKTHMGMRMFEASTPKPTHLMHFATGFDSWPSKLARTMPREVMETFEKGIVVHHLLPFPGSSKARYSGTSALTEADHYIPCYARKVFGYWEEARQNDKPETVAWVGNAYNVQPDDDVDWSIWKEQVHGATARFGINWLADAQLIEVCEAFAIATHVIL